MALIREALRAKL